MKLIFLGPPGAGKGTYSQALVEQLGIVQISTGDILRSAIKEGGALGKKAKEYMDKGMLVPDDLVINLLKDRIKHPDCGKGFILDGFPRTIPQAEALEKSGLKIDKVINFNVKDDLIVYRLSGRRVCEVCKTAWNINKGCVPIPKDPKKCDKDGSPLIQREDDKPEAIKKRLEVYREQTAPLIDFYKKRNLLADINASNDLPKIMQEIRKAIGIKSF
jgi:adenylate kinase